MGPPGATLRLLSRSARATAALGERLGRALVPGDVVALVGDLGAGKTQLVRGICRGARVPEREVASPTFAIVATYLGRLPIHHADLYRLADEDELAATGFEDLLGGEGAVLVEWADRAPGLLPPERLEVRLAHHERAPGARHLELVGLGARGAVLVESLRRSTSRAKARAKKKPRSRSRSGSGSGSRSRSGPGG
ncbi:MAG: tRNA (adenosine(37)-N6)-threonylcarbamoyltransferase complex ATPase subunit type 1 TsaE [Deltaproteobacteria bacterium]|nr:tRNA (adenosine(37)-N6)-threonylcarbamoyltransferase complex ATPase subunit type 1 TsaE [Deltaproteobacteria bacterium]